MFSVIAAALSLLVHQTYAIPLPDGVTDHGEPNLLCKSADWFTVFSFIFANYVSHAATIQIFPGEPLSRQLLGFGTSMCFPAAGISRGLNNIARGILVTTNWKQSELQRAAAAGALCMVVRTEEWTPTSEHPVHGLRLHRTNLGVPLSWRIYTPPWLSPARFIPGWKFTDEIPKRTARALRHIQGSSKELPLGYAYASVPPNALVASLVTQPTIYIAKSLSSAKLTVAILQTVWSTYGLYQARGDQTRRYGYAAFSLTVAPYAVMSVVNLIGTLLMPAYPSVFLVRSEVMQEVEQRHGLLFDGTVGTLLPVPETKPTHLVTGGDVSGEKLVSPLVVASTATSHHEPDVSIPACAEFQCKGASASSTYRVQELTSSKPNSMRPALGYALHFGISLILAVGIPLAIIGGLSRFETGNSSTSAQRGWVLAWLVTGWIYGFAVTFSLYDMAKPGGWEDMLLRAVLATPAIGGFVVVGQMLVDYGNCIVF